MGMQPEWAGRIRGRAGLVLLLAAAGAVWWGLGRWEARAQWLRVEAPRRAVAGQPLSMRVHLAPLAEPTRLCAHLHWSSTRDTSQGFLSSGGDREVGKAGGAFDFEMMVPPRAGLRFVTGILFLSKTGSWTDHTLAAGTAVIPVSGNSAEQAETRLEPLHVQPLGGEATDHPRPAALPRWLTALLFLAAAVAARGAGVSAETSSPGPRVGRRWWQGLTVLLALACLWELLGLETWLGARARSIARAEDLYYPRLVFQKAVISVAAAATLLFFLAIRRVRSSRRLLLCALALYLAIALVSLVSLHAIDQIAGLSWHGLTLVQALKLACAAMVLLGVRKAGAAPK